MGSEHSPDASPEAAGASSTTDASDMGIVPLSRIGGGVDEGEAVSGSLEASVELASRATGGSWLAALPPSASTRAPLDMHPSSAISAVAVPCAPMCRTRSPCRGQAPPTGRRSAGNHDGTSFTLGQLSKMRASSRGYAAWPPGRRFPGHPACRLLLGHPEQTQCT